MSRLGSEHAHFITYQPARYSPVTHYPVQRGDDAGQPRAMSLDYAREVFEFSIETFRRWRWAITDAAGNELQVYEGSNWS